MLHSNRLRVSVITPCQPFSSERCSQRRRRPAALSFGVHAIANERCLRSGALRRTKQMRRINCLLGFEFRTQDSMYKTQESKFRLSDGVNLEIISSTGEKKCKSPILFIHGAGHGAWCWRPTFMEYFSERNYPTYSLSLRGQAGSDVPEGAKNGGSLHQHSQDISEFIEKEIKEPPILVGHSFGGLVVQRYLTKDQETRHPVKGAILLAAAPPGGNSAMIKRIMKKNPITSIKLTWYFVRKTYLKKPKAFKWLFFSDDLPEEHMNRYHQTMLENQSKIPAVDVSKLNDELKGLGQPSHIPTLVLGAEKDIVVDQKGLEETAEYYGVKPISIPNMAHDMMLDTRWEEAAKEIEDWLERM